MHYFDYVTSSLVFLICSSVAVYGSDHAARIHDTEELLRKWGTDWAFSGIATFAHLSFSHCLTRPEKKFDIGIIGAPFDSAVSYRPGARFGPRSIREGSSRQTSFRGFNPRAGINPYKSWAEVIDCGDIPITPFDKTLALQQMTEAFAELGERAPNSTLAGYASRSKLITLGGDHSIVLPILRALKQRYGRPIAVLHFDAHMDSWYPTKYPSDWIDAEDPETPSFFTHGNMFWLASTEGLIANGSSVHAGLRSRLSGTDFGDYDDDGQQGWYQLQADDIDVMGTGGLIESILKRIGTDIPVYISVDIDVIDPGMAPGTGTPEPGGWTTRELIRILRGLETLNVIGADIVEVSPSYDDSGEVTSLAASQIAYELLTNMVKRGLTEQEAITSHRGEKDEL